MKLVHPIKLRPGDVVTDEAGSYTVVAVSPHRRYVTIEWSDGETIHHTRDSLLPRATDPCGGATKGGDGCRCDPPFNREETAGGEHRDS